MVVIPLIRIMFAYSPRKNSAKLMALYSTKKPATISLSPSGRSNGARLVSASPEMKNTTSMGSSGMANQMWRWASTMALRLRLPVQTRTDRMTRPIETS